MRTVSLFLPPTGWPRRILSFAIIGGILSSTFSFADVFQALVRLKNDAQSHAQSGVQSLAAWKSSVAAGNVAAARSDIQHAVSDLTAARTVFRSINGGISVFAKNEDALLSIAEQSARLAVLSTDILSDLAPSGQISRESLIAHIPSIDEKLQQMIPLAERLTKALNSIPVRSIPSESRERVTYFQAGLASAVSMLRSAGSLSSLLRFMMGYDAKQRFLVVFQNSAELRPTGGFAGSFALVDVNRGAISNIEFPGGGSYDLQGSLRTRLASPFVLQPINPRWEFQDANWFADFPTSAQKFMRFYEKSGGSSVDGVIAVNSRVLEKLLSITGPIDLPNYRVRVSSDNVLAETIEQVESKYDKSKNKPKAFIGDLMQIVLSRLESLSDEQTRRFFSLIVSAALTRDIQLYAADSTQQQLITRLGISGTVRQANGDFLEIVDANIGGNKSDRVMQMRISQSVKLSRSGDAATVIRIERIHSGAPGQPFFGGTNKAFVRFLVPAGSRLISAIGFSELPLAKQPSDFKADLDVLASEGQNLPGLSSQTMIQGIESGKAVFGGIITTQAGKTSLAELRYHVPASVHPLRKAYSLLVQRQSGSTISEYALRIIPPADEHITWAYPSGSEMLANAAEWRSAIDSDLFFAVNFKQ